jgi:hypothetical protein
VLAEPVKEEMRQLTVDKGLNLAQDRAAAVRRALQYEGRSMEDAGVEVNGGSGGSETGDRGCCCCC